MMTRAYLLVALSALAASGCRAAKVSEAQAVVPELKLERVRFRVYRGDALHAFGAAETTSLRRDSSDVRAEQLDATLPREGEAVRIAAPVGQGSLLSRVFEASGGVVASRGDDVGRTLRARFEPPAPDRSGEAMLGVDKPGGGSGLVRGDDPVVVQGRGYRLDGAGFTLDPASKTITLRGGARLLAGLGAAGEAP